MLNWVKRVLYGRYYVEILRKVHDEEMTTVRFSESNDERVLERIDTILSALQAHALVWNKKLIETTEQAKRDAANGPTAHM